MGSHLCMAAVFSALVVQTVFALETGLPTDQHQRSLRNNTTEWPALRFHFKLKRKAMGVFGQSDFFMYANPVTSKDGGQVLYDAFGHFEEESATYNYTFVDGIAYLSRSIEGGRSPSVRCLDTESDTIPPINAIVAAVNTATPVSSLSRSGIDCPDGNLFQLSVNSISFGLCASGSYGFSMYGSDLDIEVDYLSSHVDIAAPILSSNEKCTSSASATSITAVGEAFLTGESVPVSSSRRLRAEVSLPWESCSCKSTPRPCIFIHGMGSTTAEPENQDSLPSYWPNMTEHAPCCSSVKYSVLNTVNNTWTSDALQYKVCERALAVSETSTKTVIADTIIVTHSMGNLMLSGAIATGKCRLDSSTTWVGLAGPMRGSMASNYVQDMCSAHSKANYVMKSMVKNSGRCPPTTALKGLAYEGENHSSSAMNAAYKAAQKVYRSNVYALMCSNGFSGLLSSDQLEFWVLGLVVPHHSFQNDGMVEFRSCSAGFPETKFGNKWNDRFYKTKLNHYDMQFLHGDALLNPAKMPVKWFECLL